MQERILYEHGDLRISASEVRCKHLTIRADAITSVSVVSTRPLKWVPLALIFPAILLGVTFFLLRGLLGSANYSAFAMTLSSWAPLAVFLIIVSFVRVSRVFLQTSGGPV